MCNLLRVHSQFWDNFWQLAHVVKRLDKKSKVDLKIYDVIDWTANNYNTHITQYLKK